MKCDVKSPKELAQFKEAVVAAAEKLSITLDISALDTHFLDKPENQGLIQTIDLTMLKKPNGDDIAFQISSGGDMHYTARYLNVLFDDKAHELGDSRGSRSAASPSSTATPPSGATTSSSPTNPCFTSTSTDDANNGDYSMFWLLHPEDYDDVRKIIDEAHLLGEENIVQPGWSDPGTDGPD